MTIIEEQAAEIERLETERDRLRADLAAANERMSKLDFERTASELRAEAAEADLAKERELLTQAASDANTSAAECERLKADIAHLANANAAERGRASKYQSLAAELSDKLNGTPCAEIRWMQERDKLRTDLAAARELLKEARCHVFRWLDADLLARIDAALTKDEGRI